MSIIIKTLTKKDEPKWDQYVHSSQAATIYHTLLWRNISVKTFKHKPVFIFAEKDNAVVGVFPLFLVSGILGKRLVSVPLRDRGGPIYDNLDVLNLLIEESKKICVENNCEYLEIKNIEESKIDLELIKTNHWLNYKIDLQSDLDSIFHQFSKGHRRNINKAKKYNLTIKNSNETNEINIFYKLFLKTRKKLGVPPYSKKFFLNIFDELENNKMVELLSVYYNDIPVSSLILLLFNNTVIYAYGASNEKYLNLGINNFIQWEGIKLAHSKGYRYYDFGATSPNTPGLLRFKDSFGAFKSDNLYYYYLNKSATTPNMDSNSRKYKIVRWGFKNMPIFLSKKIGPLIAKQIS